MMKNDSNQAGVDQGGIRRACCANRGCRVMKPVLRLIVPAVGTLAVGFGLGRCHGVLTRGFHYEIRDAKTYGAGRDAVEWRYVTKSVGLAFLDPGTTELEYRGRLLFSAQRAFQENHPYAHDVQFDGEILQWDDGEFAYVLTIRPSRNGATPTAEDRGETLLGELQEK